MRVRPDRARISDSRTPRVSTLCKVGSAVGHNSNLILRYAPPHVLSLLGVLAPFSAAGLPPLVLDEGPDHQRCSRNAAATSSAWIASELSEMETAMACRGRESEGGRGSYRERNGIYSASAPSCDPYRPPALQHVSRRGFRRRSIEGSRRQRRQRGPNIRLPEDWPNMDACRPKPKGCSRAPVNLSQPFHLQPPFTR